MNRIIFHIDVNSAFLSWTAVKRLQDDPDAVDLRTIPSVVGGDVKTRHGIVTAKSIPAKKYGIQTAEPINSALQKCPKLVVVSSDFTTYRKFSHAFMDILLEYSPVLQKASIDEAFLDVTDLSAMNVRAHLENELRNFYGLSLMEDPFEYILRDKHLSDLSNSLEDDIKNLREGFPLNLAAAIRLEIKARLGFTVNVGVSVNKLLAKMASDFTKPDRTHTLYPWEIEKKMWPLDIGDLCGYG